MRKAGDDPEVVRDQQDRKVPLIRKPDEQVDHVRLRRHVERGRRLVGDQEVGIRCECHRDHHALAHPAGELVRILGEAVGRRGDADLGKERDRPLAGLGPRDVVVLPDRLDELELDRLHRVERSERVLEDHRDLPASHTAQDVLAGTGELEVAEADRTAADPARRLQQAEDRECERRLPGARLADDRDAVTAPDLERCAIDGSNDAAVNRVLDEQVLDRQDRASRGARDTGAASRPHLHYVAASVVRALPAAGLAVTSATRSPR